MHGHTVEGQSSAVQRRSWPKAKKIPAWTGPRYTAVFKFQSAPEAPVLRAMHWTDHSPSRGTLSVVAEPLPLAKVQSRAHEL